MPTMSVGARSALGIIAAFAAAWSAPALAINGLQPLRLTTQGGWRATEIITQGDSLAGLAEAAYGATLTRGLFDGIGVNRTAGAVTVWLNHESTPAAISRIELNRPTLVSMVENLRSGGSGAVGAAVTSVGFAYERVYDATYHAMTQPLAAATGAAGVAAFGTANLSRFCSGSSHAPSAFGAGRGFADEIYLTGEEVAGGRYYALDTATRSLWEATDLGVGLWENAAAVDTGESDHVAVLLSSDQGTAPGDYVRLYVGKKNLDANADGAIDFLERNGLRGGQTYYFAPSAGSLTDLPDGVVSGLWSTSTTGALRETKLEDVHTNPRNGSQLVLGAQLDGVYRLDIDLEFTPGGAFNPAASPVSITQIHDDDIAPIGAPDNVTWSYNGKVYVQEDGDGWGMFQIESIGGGITQFATGASEPSGIVDASIELGYRPGSVLLSSIMGGGTSGAQLALLVAPDAAPLVAGDYDLDGDVDGADHTAWANGHSVVGFSTADGNADGRIDAADYTVWRDAFGGAGVAVPEPTVGGLLSVFAACGLSTVPRRRLRR